MTHLSFGSLCFFLCSQPHFFSLLSSGCSQLPLCLCLFCCEFLLRNSGLFCIKCSLALLLRLFKGFLLFRLADGCDLLLSL